MSNTNDNHEPPGDQEVKCTDGVNNMNVQSLLPSFTSSSDFVNGSLSAASSIAVSAAATAVVVIAAPVKGAMMGYESYGIIGSLTGFTLGTIVGSLAGATIAVYGATSAAWSLGTGLVKTPYTLWGYLSGRDFDHDTEEWIYYDLKLDADKTLSISEEEFQLALENKITKSAILGTSSKSLSTDELKDEIKKSSKRRVGGRNRDKKSVMDTELYDILDVSVDATTSEIKKAYYIKARENHPDRNPNDANAHSKFQKIGSAYQILSDDNLRAAYDKKGKEAIENTNVIDAASLYALFFGSEMFEHLLGELQVSTSIKSLMENGISAMPSDVLQFKQRRREIQLALSLAKRLDDVETSEDLEVFQEKARKEAIELSETPLGGALLGLIGKLYLDIAKSERSLIENFLISFARSSSSVYDTLSTVSVGIKTASTAMQLNNLKEENDKKYIDDETSKTKGDSSSTKKSDGKSDNLFSKFTENKSPNQVFGLNEKSNEEEKLIFQEKTKDVSTLALNLIWLIVKSDIVSTITSVCKKVLRDHSVSRETINKRIDKLIILGGEYHSRSVEVNVGITEFIRQLGPRTGLFGEPLKPSTDYRASNDSSDEARNNDLNESSIDYENTIHINTMLRKISSEYSIKELKHHIELLKGTYSDCVEKTELQRRLCYLLLCQLEKVSKYDLLKLSEEVRNNAHTSDNAVILDKHEVFDLLIAHFVQKS